MPVIYLTKNTRFALIELHWVAIFVEYFPTVLKLIYKSMISPDFHIHFVIYIPAPVVKIETTYTNIFFIYHHTLSM